MSLFCRLQAVEAASDRLGRRSRDCPPPASRNRPCSPTGDAPTSWPTSHSTPRGSRRHSRASPRVSPGRLRLFDEARDPRPGMADLSPPLPMLLQHGGSASQARGSRTRRSKLLPLTLTLSPRKGGERETPAIRAHVVTLVSAFSSPPPAVPRPARRAPNPASRPARRTAARAPASTAARSSALAVVGEGRLALRLEGAAVAVVDLEVERDRPTSARTSGRRNRRRRRRTCVAP